jgi:hypothetical protein
MSDQTTGEKLTQEQLWEEQLNNWPYWDEILGFIEEGKCILMLGSDVSIDPDTSIPYTQQFAQELKSKLPDDEAIADNFNSIAEAYIKKWSESLFLNKIKRFYSNSKSPSLFHQYISEIPFPLIINTSPDNLLWKCYDNALFDFYDFNQNRDQPAFSGAPDMPLIYNLFGSASKPDSLVITEKDRLEFLVNIIRRNPPLPENIRSEKILNIENMFLFVGFDFNEWYLKLLLKLLSLNNKRFAYALEQQEKNVKPDSKVFYSHNFNLSFLEAPHSLFLKKLKEKYQEHNQPLIQVHSQLEPQAPNRAPVAKELMIAADSKDQQQVIEIEKMLSPLIIKGKIKTWHYEKIIPGDNPQDVLDAEIAKAEIIILCLSPESLNYHIRSGILDKMEQRKAKGENITILPLLIRSCLYEEAEQLEEYTIYPNKDGNIYSVNDSYWSDSSEAIKTLIEQIRRLL